MVTKDEACLSFSMWETGFAAVTFSIADGRPAYISGKYRMRRRPHQSYTKLSRRSAEPEMVSAQGFEPWTY